LVGGDGPLSTKLREAGIRIISLQSLQRDISLIKEIRSFFELWRIIRAEKPAILHINSSKAGAIGSLVGRLAGVPKIIFTTHGWAFNEERPFWQRLILKKIHWLTVLLSHQTIAVSKEVKRQMNWPFTQKKMTVIYNGREIKNLHSRDDSRTFITKKEPRLEKFKDDFWSMTIAELHPIKRHDAVIEAMREVVKEFPNTRHLIISDGELKESLKRKIRQAGLDENVFLLGSILEAAEYLKAADLFILASRSEAMPYVIIEACIAGLPIIATRVGGIPEVIENEKSGLLIEPLNNMALIKAILELRSNKGLRNTMASGALERSNDFAFEKTLQKTIELYLLT
ncbi:MAG: glycosyltransferase, partial [Candidatus Paceibacterota bacterium]